MQLTSTTQSTAPALMALEPELAGARLPQHTSFLREHCAACCTQTRADAHGSRWGKLLHHITGNNNLCHHNQQQPHTHVLSIQSECSKYSESVCA
jgi:hypothetical protein